MRIRKLHENSHWDLPDHWKNEQRDKQGAVFNVLMKIICFFLMFLGCVLYSDISVCGFGRLFHPGSLAEGFWDRPHSPVHPKGRDTDNLIMECRLMSWGREDTVWNQGSVNIHRTLSLKRGSSSDSKFSSKFELLFRQLLSSTIASALRFRVLKAICIQN